jgi:hypothetical protein
MNAGGRGNLLLDTQVANLEDNLDKYKSMSDVKLALRQVANTGGILARKIPFAGHPG